MSIRSSLLQGSRAKAASRTLLSPANSHFKGQPARIRSTTVLCVRRNASVVMAADGQVTLGESVIKHSARKIRRLYQDKILAGFAGSTADAFSLFSRFETKLEQYAGNLGRSAVELAKDWRTDKMLRNLEALLVVADLEQTFLISGSGDVIEPDEGIAAIGSGGSYALAAARALIENTDLPRARRCREVPANRRRRFVSIPTITSPSKNCTHSLRGCRPEGAEIWPSFYPEQQKTRNSPSRT